MKTFYDCDSLLKVLKNDEFYLKMIGYIKYNIIKVFRYYFIRCKNHLFYNIIKLTLHPMEAQYVPVT
jgi:hypothetical protein